MNTASRFVTKSNQCSCTCYCLRSSDCHSAAGGRRKYYIKDKRQLVNNTLSVCLATTNCEVQRADVTFGGSCHPSLMLCQFRELWNTFPKKPKIHDAWATFTSPPFGIAWLQPLAKSTTCAKCQTCYFSLFEQVFISFVFNSTSNYSYSSKPL